MRINFLVAATLSAALYAAPITIYNTGVDNSNVRLTNPSADTHWTLLNGPNGPGTVFAVADVGFPMGYWVPNTATSTWLSPTTNAGDLLPAGDYTFRTTFNLTGLNPLTGAFSGLFAADNSLFDVRINGVTVGISGGGFDSLTPFSFACGTNCVSGVNTIDFVVRNQAGVNTPVGLRVEIAGTADPLGGGGGGSPVPEPSTYVMMGAGVALLSVTRFRTGSKK